MGRVLYLDRIDEISTNRKKVMSHEGLNIKFISDFKDLNNKLEISEFTPEVVLADSGLCPKGGVELLRHIKANKLIGRSVPIIILSENYDKTEQIEELVSGAVDIIFRETNSDYIIAKIRALLRLKEEAS